MLCARPKQLYALCLAMLAMVPALAQAQPEREAPDTTRLDVERLPPEVIEPTRDMFATGWHLRAEIGGQGFAGAVGRISTLGPAAQVAFGYELTRWFALSVEVGLSMHPTDAPAPPSPSTFQLYTGLVQARLQVALSTRAALWLSADGGGGFANGDILQTYGYGRAGELGFVYGGALGFDWHLMNAHQSLGARLGAHLYPNLDSPRGERAVALQGALYLKYVF